MSAIQELQEKFKNGELEYKKFSEICRLLGVTGKSERIMVERILKEAESDGMIVRDSKNRYVRPERIGLVKGVISGNERGFAFLLREGGEDVFIPHRALHGALHKDTVFVRVVAGERGEEGEVYCILSRGLKKISGTYYRERKGGFVEADEKKFSEPIRVTGGKVRAVSGEKVLVKITAYPEGRCPEGEIEEVLGRSGELFAEEDAIILSAGLAGEFSQKVLASARAAAEEKPDLTERKDFRDLLTITIDGETAKDFDDAISIEKTEGGYLLGVHIADVSNYVKRGSVLDKEAYARGTSVYFPDRVLPMLPEVLSNGVCSLNEGVDRLTVSCMMRTDEKGKVIDSQLYTSVIRSSARMTYTSVAKILEGDEEERKKYKNLVGMLEDCNALAKLLSTRRSARGSVDFDVKEAEITLLDGVPEVKEAERTPAHKMIEEFMLLANETVASFLEGYEMPCVYRIHEKPAEEKAAAFKTFLDGLGIRSNLKADNVHPGEYASVLKKLEGDPRRRVVNRVMLRSMSKARYSGENIGHFGLASDCYCHFTSPIRRYPDLIVHRILKLVLSGRAGEAEEFASFIPNAATHCSETERRADDAERDVDELYKCMYLHDRMGQEFDAVVSGVTAFGVFAELENTVEGIIRIENLPSDDYAFSEERYLLKGKKYSFRIGDPIKIKVVACDLGTRKCEFILAEEQE